MKQRRTSMLLLLATLFGCAATFAGPTSDLPLQGLKNFRLTIHIDDEAKDCGVGREVIEAAVLSVLRPSRLRLDDTARNQIGARATTMKVSETACAFSFALEVVPLVTIADTGIGAFATVWSRQAVTAGPTSGAPRLVAEVFQHASRELVADWKKAND